MPTRTRNLTRSPRSAANAARTPSSPEGFAKGGEGAKALAEKVAKLCTLPAPPVAFAYPDDAPVEEKIAAVAKNVYGAGSVSWSEEALTHLQKVKSNPEYARYPVCIAKTQYSFSCDEKALRRARRIRFPRPRRHPPRGCGVHRRHRRQYAPHARARRLPQHRPHHHRHRNGRDRRLDVSEGVQSKPAVRPADYRTSCSGTLRISFSSRGELDIPLLPSGFPPRVRLECRPPKMRD